MSSITLNSITPFKSTMGVAALQLLQNPIIKLSSIIDWGKQMAHANEFIQRDLIQSCGIPAYHPADRNNRDGFTDSEIATINNTISNNSPGADIFCKDPTTNRIIRVQSKLRQVKGRTDFSHQTHFETTRRNSVKNQNQNQSGHVAYNPNEFDYVLVTLVNVRENLSRRNNINLWSFSCVPVRTLINPTYGCCETKIRAQLLNHFKVSFTSELREHNNKHLFPIEYHTGIGISLQLNEAEQRALANYEKFHNLPHGTSNLEDVTNSSAGFEGWLNYIPYASACSKDSESGANAMMTTLG